jgi:hypothetical protein
MTQVGRSDAKRNASVRTRTADYAALIEKQDTQALSYIKQGRRWAQRTLALDSMCYDAYLALGVEN